MSFVAFGCDTIVVGYVVGVCGVSATNCCGAKSDRTVLDKVSNDDGDDDGDNDNDIGGGMS